MKSSSSLSVTIAGLEGPPKKSWLKSLGVGFQHSGSGNPSVLERVVQR